jgi:hypothetical protein
MFLLIVFAFIKIRVLTRRKKGLNKFSDPFTSQKLTSYKSFIGLSHLVALFVGRSEEEAGREEK